MSILFFALFSLLAFAFPDRKFIQSHLDNHQYIPPGPGDHRSPCPGWNVLANHGYINRNGRNVSYDDFLAAATEAFGLAQSVTIIAAVNAQNVAKVFPGGVMPSLHVLNATHNIIEHDASLTRDDFYLGNNVVLNPTLLNQLLPDLSATLTRDNIVAHRSRRISDSKRRNPTFTWKLATQQPVAAAESAFLHTMFGQGNGTMPARWLYQFLKEERIPTGWTPRQVSLLEFTGVTAYYLAREIVSFGNSGMSQDEAMTYAHKAVKRFVEQSQEK